MIYAVLEYFRTYIIFLQMFNLQEKGVLRHNKILTNSSNKERRNNMKFRATVMAKSLPNITKLTQALYLEGGPNSKIEINDKRVTMEIEFNQIPKDIITAITYCKIIEFYYKGDELECEPTNEGIMKVQILREDQKENRIKDFLYNFFCYFDSNSSIEVKESQVRIEKFISISKEIIQELGLRNLFKNSTRQEMEKLEGHKWSKREIEAEETSDESEQEEAEEESFDESEQEETVEEETSDQPKLNEEEDFAKHEKNYAIQDLDEIAEESTSYQEFVSSVIEKFELGGRQKTFRELINAAEQVQKINWSTLKAFLVKNKIAFNWGDQGWFTNQVAKKSRESQSNVTILKLIKAIVEYKTFNFKCEKEEKTVCEVKVESVEDPKTEQEPAEEEISDQSEQGTVEDEKLEQPELKESEKKTTEIQVVTSSTSNVKMECMPEIPEFEEVLKSVDKTQTPQEISEHILRKMGLAENNEKEKQYIISIVSAALETDLNDFESICDKVNIPKKSRLFAQLTFSKFINNYVKMFYPDNAAIKGTEFLKELKEAVMS